MKRIIASLIALAVLAGASVDWQHGDSRWSSRGWTMRHWALVPDVIFIKPACAAGFIRSGGGPCGGATTYTFAGPNGGVIDQTTTNYTVQPVGSLSTSVVVTPSDASHGGIFAPTTVTMSGAGAQSFTYTPLQPGTYNLSVANGGGLTNPSPISFTVANLLPGYPGFTTGWTSTGDVALTTGIAGDPFGGSAAAKLTEDGATSPHAIITSTPFAETAFSSHIMSTWIKAGTGSARNVALSMADSTNAAQITGVFDPVACTFVFDASSNGAVVSHSANVINSWCLVQITGTLGNFTSANALVYVFNGTNFSYAGDGTSNVLIYGASMQ